MESSAPDSRPTVHGSLANALTYLRLASAPVCAWLLVLERDHAALLLFALAVTTDLIDGPIARRRGETSNFGALLDHGSDATFVVLGLAALATRGLVPVALAPLVALAFVQYTLDSKVLAGHRLRASTLGRWNGIAYFVLLGTPLVRNTAGLAWPSEATILLLGWALTVSTGVSILDRLIALLRAAAAPPSP